MNDQGLEGSVETAMAEIEDDVASKHAEDGSQLKTGGDGEADDAGVGLSAHQGASDDGDGDDDILRAEHARDRCQDGGSRTGKETTFWSIKASEKDATTGTIGAWKSEASRQTNKRHEGVRRWTHRGIGREHVARTVGWWAAAQLRLTPEESKKQTQPEDNQGQGQSRIRGCSAQKNS